MPEYVVERVIAAQAHLAEAKLETYPVDVPFRKCLEAARAEIDNALDRMDRDASPHADKTLRPGLNKPTDAVSLTPSYAGQKPIGNVADV